MSPAATRITIPEDEIEGHGPIDPYLGVIRIDSAAGSPIAAVMHYTCHAAVVSPAPKQYSSDYPGLACRMVERLFGYGITAMFVNGAFGNINHIMKPTQFNAMAFGTAAERPFEEAERVGQSVAAKALELLPKIETRDVEVGSLAKSLTVALRRPPASSLQEAEAEIKRQQQKLEEAQKRGDEDEAAEAQISRTYAVHWANYYRNEITEVELRLAAIKIGNLGISCISGEPFVEIGFNIKGQSPFKDSWVLGNTCGYSGYLPTEESFQEGGYEVRTCGWSKWKTDADKAVISESVKLLGELSD
jgi:RNA polymerase-binding transcription factor DksA